MERPCTLFTGQWADLSLEKLAQKASEWGYDGLELACWGDHLDVRKAASSDKYCRSRHEILEKYGLKFWSISNHLVGQAVCDNIDERHQAILPPHIYGTGKPEQVRRRAAKEMMVSAEAAKALGVKVVNGFTGSSIWSLLYSFPPVAPDAIDAGYRDFADRWNPILDAFKKNRVRFALEVHPTEIAFDTASAARAVKALKKRKEFGFNYDPSHLVYQNVDYVGFLREFKDRIYHVHMKDAYLSPLPTRAGIFGGHTDFGNPNRSWDFRSLGRGSVDFEEIIRALNDIGYKGPLSVEWEDSGMDREHGAEEACSFVNAVDFESSGRAFDAAFAE
ncbi:MAG TPA: AP endonuclease [Candidatus Latescibacteria bacterium]|nr:AP endonuclease [Gemmatimonadota bacterium]HCR17519.1 AP endonuclease [Candidatus Latescibacterota bacterium]|tara:strand:+ start:74 stop:1072 length:999 start_codon:yes stop_codon:yes gene_type:complete